MGGLTHASFFSGAGGLDLGLERAGWRTVSFSEIDPYACAVLAERWPGVPNLGDVVAIAHDPQPAEPGRDGTDWRGADLWTGGFPCQDLSVAGKRRGMVEGSRSNLAHAFLDLVERYRPPCVLLENVPGLLSSHRGRDMAALLGRLAELGYGVAYRVLDARHFGVPQRRRRVFIVGLRSGPDDPSGRAAAERAAQVLAVGSRCGRHPPAGVEAGSGAAGGAGDGADIVGVVPAGLGHHGNGGHSSQAVAAGHVIATAVRASDGHHGHGSPRGDGGDNLVVGASPDAGRDGAADGLAGWLDDREELAAAVNSGGNSGGFRTEPGEHLVAFTKRGRAQTTDDPGSWGVGDVMPTLNSFDVGDVRTTAAILGGAEGDDPLLPLGLDSHRYRCVGNGVVAPVAYWLGKRLREALS